MSDALLMVIDVLVIFRLIIFCKLFIRFIMMERLVAAFRFRNIEMNLLSVFIGFVIESTVKLIFAIRIAVWCRKCFYFSVFLFHPEIN